MYHSMKAEVRSALGLLNAHHGPIANNAYHELTLKDFDIDKPLPSLSKGHRESSAVHISRSALYLFFYPRPCAELIQKLPMC